MKRILAENATLLRTQHYPLTPLQLWESLQSLGLGFRVQGLGMGGLVTVLRSVLKEAGLESPKPNETLKGRPVEPALD